MARKSTRLPALTTLDSIKEALDVRLGRRGDKKDAAVTFRDLEESGAFKLLGRAGGAGGSGGSGGSGLLPLPPEDGPAMPPWMGQGEDPETWVPSAPTGFLATAMFDGIFIEWDWPPKYGIVSHTEVFRAKSNNAKDRKLVATVSGLNYFDTIDGADETEYFYWVRFRSIGNIVGPYVGPESAVSIPMVKQIIDRIEGEVTETELAKSLNTRIDKIEVIEGEVVLVDEKVDQVQAATEDEFAAVRQDFRAEIDEVEGTVNSMYTLRVQSGDKIAGFGISNDGRTSDFAVIADRFAIVNNYGSTKTSPFFVTGDNVYMRSALIQNASIDSAQIKDAAINRAHIRDATIDAVHISWAAITSAKIRHAAIQRGHIRDAAIGSAQIGQAAIKTANIGHAEVDTLNLKGHAVTIPVGSSFGRISHTDVGWVSVGEAWLDLEGSGSSIIVAGRWDGYVSSWSSPLNGNASASVEAQVKLVAYDHTPYGLRVRNAGIIQTLSDSDFDSGGGNNEGGSAYARVGGPVNFTWLFEDVRYNVKVELLVLLSGGYRARGATYGGHLGVIGAKR